MLLTLTLASGFVFSEELFGKPVTFTHKNVFSRRRLARPSRVLLFGRWRYGWRGRTALRWILAGTLLLVLGYLGSKFVLEVLLRIGMTRSRHRPARHAHLRGRHLAHDARHRARRAAGARRLLLDRRDGDDGGATATG